MKIVFILGFICTAHISATKLTVHPQEVLKGHPVTLTCESELTQPVTYTWLKNGHKIANLTSSKWTIVKASIDTRNNFTCIVETKNGSVSQADVFLNVIAPPTIIKGLTSYYGVLYTSTNISLTCRVECYPLCSISWFKDDRKIKVDDGLYYIKTEMLPADHHRNDFESVVSTLVWNLTNWPNKRVKKYSRPSQYTCKSNNALVDVKSTTRLAAEYPPEHISLSTKSSRNVTEGEIPDAVTCSAKGSPDVEYFWKHSPTGVVESTTGTLRLGKLSRFEVHNYTCEAINKHGIKRKWIHFNVMYKPTCSIELGKIDDRDALICKASGNPEDFTFKWKLGSSDVNNSLNYLILDSGSNLRNYECLVGNSVGFGSPCSKTVSGRPLAIDLSKVAGDIIEGMVVLLKCNIKATFAVQITWYNNSDVIDNSNDKITTTFTNQSDVFTTSSQYKFTARRWDDHTNIKCSATNKFLRGHNIPLLEKTLRLEVLYSPVVTVTSIATTFVEGDNQTAVLFCNYDANPLRPVSVTWRKNGNVLIRNKGKHTFVTLHNLSLIIANVTREDKGEYSCSLSNKVGESTSEDLSLDVLYSPTVEVTMTTSLPPPSSFQTGNLTLSCHVTSGNPFSLSQVQWFVNSHPLDNYSKTNRTNVKNVHLSNDSHNVTISSVSANYSQTFTCQGINKAGAGAQSRPFVAKIAYPAVATKLTQRPKIAFKGHPVTLECSIDARLDSVSYVWLNNGYRLRHLRTSTWTVRATLELRNITCFATNGGRSSVPTAISVKMAARPVFLSRPKPYVGVLKSSRDVSLTCRVECYPICSVLWTTEGRVISSDSMYNVSRKVLSADFRRNDFESVESTLTFSRSHLRNDGLYVYSCASVSPTSYVPDVNASIMLGLENPPENLTVSEHSVVVRENERPKTVTCVGNGRPHLSYKWIKASSSEVVAWSANLTLDKLAKSEEGNYTCEGYNKHGRQSVNVTFHVTHYKPICSITFGNLGMQQALICSAESDTDVTYTWKSNSSNGVLASLDAMTMNSRSFFIFNHTTDYAKRYICLVENTIGRGKPCGTFLPRPPSRAKIQCLQAKVLKASNATLECSVDDPGFPKSLTYVWFLNKENVHNSSRPTWDIRPISLKHRNSTFSCLVKNDAGFSLQSDEIGLNVVAAPRFVQAPPRSLSVYYDVKRLSLVCRVECLPLCSVVWLKNDRSLGKSELYYVDTKIREADYEEGLFESVESTLVWNLTKGNVLDKSEGVSKYTCVTSDSAGIRSRISSSSRITVDFAPENLTLSRTILDVIENEASKPVECRAKGHPLNFTWLQKSSSKVITTSNILQLEKVSISDSGYYTCVVSNKYGSNSVSVYVNVLYAPRCKVSFDATTNSLACTADGNPPDISYVWEMDSFIDEIDASNVVDSKDKSLLILTDELMRRELDDYRCVASNPIGYSQPCIYNDSSI